VSGCNPYLESLPSYTDGAPPWAPINKGHGITSRPLKRDPESLTYRLQGIMHWHRSTMFTQPKNIHHA